MRPIEIAKAIPRLGDTLEVGVYIVAQVRRLLEVLRCPGKITRVVDAHGTGQGITATAGPISQVLLQNAQVFELARRLEALFGRPQDIEWTWGSEGLTVLQSRPVTTTAGTERDAGRRWYLSLRRSFENLQSLRAKIEDELIPSMVKSADALALRPTDLLADEELAAEIEYRREVYDRWVDVYWEEFIPFAHGIRLFGQVYNDALRPDDPYAFMDLLTGTSMASLARNRALEQMAAQIRENRALRNALESGESLIGSEGTTQRFVEDVKDFVERFGDLSCPMTGSGQCAGPPDALIRILLEMAEHPPRHIESEHRDSAALEQEYLSQFAPDEKDRAVELLDLARASYRLRDDDNIFLGRIEAQLMVAVEEGRRRLSERGTEGVVDLSDKQVVLGLRCPDFVPTVSRDEQTAEGVTVRARQAVGQPAGPGVANGPARVIISHTDLAAFRHGEVLICDAVDPNMTFVVPLAAAVVERRGGMLIHGAIIAREYGLPCVTGVPAATELIRTGDSVTVDGYLGVVTIVERAKPPDLSHD